LTPLNLSNDRMHASWNTWLQLRMTCRRWVAAAALWGAGEHLIVVLELLFADGARQLAVVAAARLVLGSCPLL
jgi:hypothetical protein